MEDIELTAEQEAEADRILDVVVGAARVEIRQLARLIASKSNRELCGATEFRIREIVHGIGARVIESALEERKKRGIAAPAGVVRHVANPPSLSMTVRLRPRR